MKNREWKIRFVLCFLAPVLFALAVVHGGERPASAPPIDERLTGIESRLKTHDSTLKTHGARLDLVERDLEKLTGKPCPCDKGGKCICGENCKCELCLEHLTNIDVVNLYAAHEEVISKIWESLPEEKTMRDAVKIWITQQHARNNGVESVKPPLRAEYEAEVEALVKLRESLEAQGKGAESIARTLHAARREIGEKYKNLTPEDLREKIYERNQSVYGDPLGPSIDWLRNQGKSWEQIADSASDPGDWPPKGMEPSELRRAIVAGASWCGPCQVGNRERKAAGLVEGEDYEYFDVDKRPDLKAKYGVTDMPALILLEGDTVKEHHTGLTGMTKKLQEWICREALPAGAGTNPTSKTGQSPAVSQRMTPNDLKAWCRTYTGPIALVEGTSYNRHLMDPNATEHEGGPFEAWQIYGLSISELQKIHGGQHKGYLTPFGPTEKKPVKDSRIEKPTRFSYQMPVMYRPRYFYTEPSFSQRFLGSSCPNCR